MGVFLMVSVIVLGLMNHAKVNTGKEFFKEFISGWTMVILLVFGFAIFMYGMQLVSKGLGG